MKQREKFSSRLGFLLIAAGCATTDIYNRLMMDAMEAGDYETALGLAEKGLQLEDGLAEKQLKFNEAVCYEYLGNWQKALSMFEAYVAEQCEKLDVECNYDGFNFGIVHRLFSRYQLLSKFNCQLSLITLAYVQKSHYRKNSAMTFLNST